MERVTGACSADSVQGPLLSFPRLPTACKHQNVIDQTIYCRFAIAAKYCADKLQGKAAILPLPSKQDPSKTQQSLDEPWAEEAIETILRFPRLENTRRTPAILACIQCGHSVLLSREIVVWCCMTLTCEARLPHVYCARSAFVSLSFVLKKERRKKNETMTHLRRC